MRVGAAGGEGGAEGGPVASSLRVPLGALGARRPLRRARSPETTSEVSELPLLGAPPGSAWSDGACPTDERAPWGAAGTAPPGAPSCAVPYARLNPHVPET
jgi:hypothetical protein